MKLQKMALAALAVTGAGLIPSQAQAQSTTEIIETVGAMILADRLGIDPNLIMLTQMNSGSSVFDLAPALTMGSYGQADPLQVLAMQNMGMGWPDIARVGGVPAPIYSTLLNTRQLNSNAIWADELGSRYGNSDAYLQQLHNAGYSWKEIAEASVESQETGRSIEDVLYQNRLNANNYQANYNYYNEPIYVPARRTVRYASILPPPRRDWELVGTPFTSNQVIWVDEFNQPTRFARRPVITRWSSQRIVREPLFVRLGNSNNYRIVNQPFSFKAKNKNRFFVQASRPRLAPQTIMFERPTIFVTSNVGNRWAFRETTDHRAQRLVFDPTRQRELERERILHEMRFAANDRRRDTVQDLRQRELAQRRLEEARRRRLEQQRRELRHDARDDRKDAIADQRRRELAQKRLEEARQRRLEQQRRETRNDARVQRRDATQDQRKRKLAQKRLEEARQRRLDQQRRETRNNVRVQRKDAIQEQRKRELAQQRTQEARQRRLDQQRRETRNDARAQRRDAIQDQRRQALAQQKREEARKRRLEQERRQKRGGGNG